jgi:excisionase family DNA binding protein
MEKMIDVEALADLLGVSLVWTYKAVRQKALPFYRVGKCVRFRESEILSWLEERKSLALRMPRKLRKTT